MMGMLPYIPAGPSRIPQFGQLPSERGGGTPADEGAQLVVLLFQAVLLRRHIPWRLLLHYLQNSPTAVAPLQYL